MRKSKQRRMLCQTKRRMSAEEEHNGGWRVGADVAVLHWGLYLDPSGRTISMHREENSKASITVEGKSRLARPTSAQLAFKEAAVKLVLGLPHVLRLQLAKRRCKRMRMEPHWTSPPGRVRERGSKTRSITHCDNSTRRALVVVAAPPRTGDTSAVCQRQLSPHCTIRWCDVSCGRCSPSQQSSDFQSEASMVDFPHFAVQPSPGIKRLET
jgi:hypothetical protein